MRLLNTQTYELQEFVDDQIPEYVILSHRWGEGEVTYKEFRKGQNKDGAGYKKIMQCCAFARSKVREWGNEYKVWIDTCCIDKRSSAELSEAINSMWSYYANARECYAYLVDVPSLTHGREAVMRRLQTSTWFTRGWTLQELLAPSAVLFCNREWEIVGNKRSLARVISSATRIPEEYVGIDMFMNAKYYAMVASVAERLSWASNRQTMRAEDRAYCLLGLFDVNMPLLYGEGGENAFRRLQLEIISRSDDESIFAWAGAPSLRHSTMLAPSPAAFTHSVSMRRTTIASDKHAAEAEERNPYAMTNKGLHFSASALRVVRSRDSTLPNGSYAVALKCFELVSKRRYIVLLGRQLAGVSTQNRIHPHATPDAVDELIRSCEWEDVGLVQFYIR